MLHRHADSIYPYATVSLKNVHTSIQYCQGMDVLLSEKTESFFVYIKLVDMSPVHMIPEL